MHTGRSSRLVLVFFVAALGCAEPSAPELEHAGPVGPLAGAPIDDRALAAVMERAHFAFRPSADGALAGGHTTYGVLARPGGAFEITPVPPTGAGAPVELETIAVGDDQDPPSPVAITEHGAVEMGRAGSRERLENREDGVEQSWLFERAPVDRGDLVVRVRVSSPLVATTARGLHFRHDDAETGIVYGVATWIDARGERTELRPEAIEGGLAITVPAAIVARSGFPAVLDPLIGPEIAVDTPIVAPTRQFAPTVAFDGARYLVAWIDQRHGYDAVFATRVGTDGAVLDPSGIEISSGRELFTDWLVSAAGPSGFVVGWSERCLACAPSTVSIHASRVASDGRVLDRPSVLIADDVGGADGDVAYGAGVYLFAYRTLTGPIWGRTFDPALGPAAPFAIAGGTPGHPSVASDGSRFVVAYTTGDIYAVPVTTAGAVGTAVAVVTGSVSQVEPSLAFDGSNYVLAWWESTGPWDIYARRLTPTLGLLPTMAIATSSDSETRPMAASAGTGESIVLWTRLGSSVEVRSRRVSSAGVLLDPVGGVLVGPGTNSAVPFDAVGNASSFFVAFTDAQGRLRGATVDASGPAPAGGALLATGGGNAERQAAVAFDGTNHLVVWSDSRGGTYDVYGVRVDANGRPLDSVAIPIGTDPMRTEELPDVAFGGGTYYVVWDASGEVRGARVSTAGALLDTTPVVIGSSAFAGPAVASDGTSFLVAWNASIVGLGGPVNVRPISSATGAPSGAATAVQTLNAWITEAVDVAYGGGAYLVAYTDGNVLARRVSATGALLGAGPLTLAATSDPELTPTVSYSGSAFLVAWERRSTDADVYGARVSSTGALLDATPRLLAGGAGRQLAPTLAPDASGYLLGWQHDSVTSYDVRIGWLDATGTPTVDGDVAVATTSDPEVGPALTASATGGALIVYEHHTFDDGARPVRVVTRVLGGVGRMAGATCTVGTECASGHCVDGVCCASACGDGDGADCQACSVAAGAAVDGTCAPLAGATRCRGSAGACDLEEVCDGTSTACPADARAASDVVCRAAVGACDVEERCGGAVLCPADVLAGAGAVCRGVAGVCDVAEVCDGASAACPSDGLIAGIECRPTAGECDIAERCDGSGPACPADAVIAAGELCRVAAGACDVLESCDGSSPSCPPDGLATASTLCRASSGTCDPGENCTGLALDCPADVLAADGASCDDGAICNGTDLCISGTCTASAAPDCDDADPCTADACADPGGCEHELALGVPGCCATASDCDDGDPCTVERCAADGACALEPGSACEDAGVAGDGGRPAGDATVVRDGGAASDGGVPRDAGSMDASAPDGGGASAAASGCGCSAPGGGAHGFGVAAITLAIGMVLGRRHRRRSRRP
jgi:hypothetical protein